jgi:hypothetical protein
MPSLISTLARFAIGARPDVTCSAEVWTAGLAELRRRAGGYRESGAFLLGTKGPTRRIEQFVYYDDIDAGALSTGIVIIDGRKLGALWDHCRHTKLEVVADVHVHPQGYWQSRSDQHNPIIAEIGHKAIIIPDYACKSTLPGKIGVYEYLGARRWRDDSSKFFSPLHVGWWPQWQ